VSHNPGCKRCDSYIGGGSRHAACGQSPWRLLSKSGLRKPVVRKVLVKPSDRTEFSDLQSSSFCQAAEALNSFNELLEMPLLRYPTQVSLFGELPLTSLVKVENAG
jgi:hypothetical protein